MSGKKKTSKIELEKAQSKSKIPTYIGLAVLMGIIGLGAFYLLNNPTNSNEESAKISEGNPKTPTEAYKKLFEAVSTKDKEGIKSMMSKDSINLAKMQAGQSKKDIDDVLKNAFFTANKASKLPAIRDERVKGRYGAVEVYSQSKNHWENIPFIVEEGAWKLAAGNMFAGNFKSPGESQTITERKAANLAGKRDLVPYGNGNLNTNVKPKIINPTKDGKIPPNLRKPNKTSKPVKKIDK